MATDTEIKASKVPARNNYGQNGSPLASSLLPGQTKSPTADVAPKTCDVPGLRDDDQLSHRVKIGEDGKPTAYASHDSMPARGVDSGSPGGTVPAATHRRDSGKSLLK